MKKKKKIEITITTRKKRNQNEIFLIEQTRSTTRYKKNIWLVVNSTFIQNYDTIAESWLGSDQQPFQLRLIGRRPRIALGRSILLVIGGSYPLGRPRRDSPVMSIAAKSQENCRMALVPNRCIGEEEGTRDIG